MREDMDALKVEVKKLSAKAMQLKMDLHDLSEELPLNWAAIPELARRTHEAFRLLAGKRAELKQLEAVEGAGEAVRHG